MRATGALLLAVALLAGVAAAARAQTAAPDTETEPEAGAEPEPGTEPEAEEAEAEAEAEAEEEAEAEAEAEEEAEAEAEAEEEAEAEAEEEAEEEEEAEAGGGHHGGVGLPGQFRLHGMFDVAYERIGYTDDLGDGRDALRNYHHFLFLRREARGDPFSIDIELVDLTFYEIGVRFTERKDPWKVEAKLGKILVPFGDEPLFHHGYGGETGFDQGFVPFVWARHGARVQVQRRLWDLHVTNDAYVVQGHAIAESDAVIDLQRDLSPADDVRWAFGDRVGVSWDALSVWYSIYYNRLGFDRQLLLQAIDIGLWRLRDVPVLEDLSIGVGLVRADVSGGTWTEDRVPLEHYYHFGDYLTLQYHLTHWLRLEARTGIITTNNRDGVYVDSDRDDVTDVTAHTLGASARFGGFTASLHHHWRLEERDEIDDDFLRLRLSYAF